MDSTNPELFEPSEEIFGKLMVCGIVLDSVCASGGREAKLRVLLKINTEASEHQ